MIFYEFNPMAMMMMLMMMMMILELVKESMVGTDMEKMGVMVDARIM